MHAPTVTPATDGTAVRPRAASDALPRAVLAGFAASLIMLLMFLVAYNLARLLAVSPTLTAQPIEPLRSWLDNLTHNRLIDAGLADVYLAAGVYFAGGLLWALVYVLVEARLPGTPIQRGIVFAMLPALISLVVVLPVFGGGLFGFGLGAGPLPLIGNVLLHVVYGAVLGVVCGPFGDLDASTLQQPVVADGDTRRAPYEPLAALLLVGGLIVGSLAGLAASLMAEQSGATILGESNAGLILWGGLLGAMVGLFVGSFMGLGRSTERRSGS